MARKRFLGRLAAEGWCSVAEGVVLGPTIAASPLMLQHGSMKDGTSQHLCSSTGTWATADGRLRQRRPE